MVNFKTKLLNVLTLGILGLIAKKKSNQTSTPNDVLTLGTKSFKHNITSVVKSLGGSKNILDVTATISSVTIKLNDSRLVNIDEIKKMSTKGVLKNGNNITLVVGDCANDLKQKITNYKND